ncbi:MAG: efflux transporter outer membrane subunit [Thalassotalea sp.]
MNHSNKLSVVIATLALTACSMAPNYQTPETLLLTSDAEQNANAPHQLALNKEQKTNGKKLNGQALNWQAFYQDRQVKRLITLALENNKSLEIAEHQLAQLQAKYQIEASSQWPQLALGVSGQRQKNSLNQSTSFSEYSSVYNTNIGFTAYELDFFGRVTNLKNAALSDFKANQYALQTLRQSTAAHVAQLYFELQATALQLSLQNQLSVSAKKVLQIQGKKFSLGIIAATELAQSNVRLSQVNLQIQQLTTKQAQISQQLQAITGYAQTSEINYLNSQFDLTLLKPLPVTLASSVLLNRPDIAQAEEKIKAANANLGVARAAFFPSISLTSNIGLTSNALSDLFDANSQTWLFMPQINLPIFTAGRLTAQETIAELQQKIEIKQYQHTIENAFTEFQNQLSISQALTGQLKQQQKIVVSQQQQLTLADHRLAQGLDDITDVEQAKQALLLQQQNLAGLQLSYLSNQLNLFKVIAGNYTTAPLDKSQDNSDDNSSDNIAAIQSNMQSDTRFENNVDDKLASNQLNQ